MEGNLGNPIWELIWVPNLETRLGKTLQRDNLGHHHLGAILGCPFWEPYWSQSWSHLGSNLGCHIWEQIQVGSQMGMPRFLS